MKNSTITKNQIHELFLEFDKAVTQHAEGCTIDQDTGLCIVCGEPEDE